MMTFLVKLEDGSKRERKTAGKATPKYQLNEFKCGTYWGWTTDTSSRQLLVRQLHVHEVFQATYSTCAQSSTYEAT